MTEVDALDVSPEELELPVVDSMDDWLMARPEYWAIGQGLQPALYLDFLGRQRNGK